MVALPCHLALGGVRLGAAVTRVSLAGDPGP